MELTKTIGSITIYNNSELGVEGFLLVCRLIIEDIGYLYYYYY